MTMYIVYAAIIAGVVAVFEAILNNAFNEFKFEKIMNKCTFLFIIAVSILLIAVFSSSHNPGAGWR